MKALCWYGKQDLRVETVPDPRILNPRDCIVRVTLSAICGSDLHLYDGLIPTMEKGDILGHEFVGEVVEVGSEITNLSIGDRVVVPFPLACGSCHFCHGEEYALCDNSNPNAMVAEKLFGYSPAGIFGYSHIYGGYAGGQAQYVRVPFADVGPMKLPDEVSDEAAIMLADILPTAYQAALYAGAGPGKTVAIWGCGPVGLLTIQAAQYLGAERVIAIDFVPERLARARHVCGAEVLNFEDDPVLDALREMTAGRGPDACIDAVGMEAHGLGLLDWYDRAKQTLRLETDRPHALREAIMACGKGGILSIPGVYGGILDKVPMGAAFAKGLTFKMGQTHVHKYLAELVEALRTKQLDPTFIITHRTTLEAAPQAYAMFQNKDNACIKVVLTP
jgi:threonine dehydrogenase-like Zn-dependent dehydrogenase